MKLLTCHIENFGTLSDRTFDFSEGLNVLCEPNGFGKSTLAAFIRAMFYGLPSYRSNTTEFVDRKHYYPFNAGKFGGSLTFSMNGHVYRIERTFGIMSDKDDRCKVYCDDVTTEEFTHSGREIGHFVFGIDRDAYDRLLSIGSADISIETTPGISAKLNHLVNATDEATTYDTALRILTEARKRLKADKKSAANKDALTHTSERIKLLEEELRNLTAIRDALGRKYEQMNALRSELSTLESHIAEVHAADTLRAAWDTYDALSAQAAKKAQELDTLRAQYPNGLPGEEELSLLNNAAGRITTSANDAAHAAQSEADISRLAYLRTQFTEGVPSEKTMATLDAQLDAYVRLAGEVSRTEGTEKSQRLLSLENRFRDGCPTEEQLSEQDAALSRLGEIDALLSAGLTAPTPAPRTRPVWLYLLAAVFLSLCIGGGIACLVSPPVGIILLSVGGIGLIATAALLLRSARTTSAAPQENTAQISLLHEKALLQKSMCSFLAAYRYTAEHGAEADYATLKRDLDDYRNERKRFTQATEEHRTLSLRCEELKRTIADTLAAYGITQDLREGLTRLRKDADDYHRLTEQEATLTEKRTAAITDVQEVKATVENILLAYGIQPQEDLTALILTLRSARDVLIHLEGEHKKLLTDAEAYRSEKGLTERPVYEPTHSSDEMEMRANDLREALVKLTTEIEKDERAAEPIDSHESALEKAREELEKIKARIKILIAARTSLEQAENTLKERYIQPVKELFLRYVEPIERILGERMHMDGDFSIKFERNSEMRSDRHLSAGQHSILALCFRLALLDNMYREEQPPIIMDDPFIYLDAEHLEKTLALIPTLSERRQILYFTCHDSRSAIVKR